MRPSPVAPLAALLAGLIVLPCAAAEPPAGDPGAGIAATGQQAPPAKTGVFVNHKVSTRKIAVNQSVRLEFTTMPRQIEGVDVAAAVVNGVGLAGGTTWRLVGKPTVTESEKTRTITVVVTLQPRATGDLALPSFALSWLTGDPRPDFGTVSVSQAIAIGGETKPLPPEYDGVGGFLWGAKQEDLIGKQIPAAAATTQGDRTVAKVSGSLELGFRSGELSDAVLLASGVTVDSARTSFCERWGLPLGDDQGTLTWVLGWTRITAAAATDGVRIELVREDLQAKQAANQVKSRVFNLLEGATGK